ncbi:MAG: U32 family peptidase [Planctomycetaceae bacterium]|nr:U32 family peptidase [Planctomycetaceae bacterium]
MNRKIELLAPAKDAETAIAAITCGADAVYMGAERFGARQAAANSPEDIKKVLDFAHQYYAKVYIALNILMYDGEITIAEKMIQQLYAMGIDGLIIQDMGLLELDLPPIPLIASTQMDNSSLEKVKFLQDVGFSRAILARELSIEEIKHIRDNVSIDLECFVHGALCVSKSGQCYLSCALGGRSGNRGQCAQPCRRLYTLKDEQGNILTKDRYLLSIKDLNLSGHLEELIDAGISTFKIEGRLKDVTYVVNTVSYYRKLLDSILEKRNLQKNSSGKIHFNFEPNPEKTFNRGFTDFNFADKQAKIGSINTPKTVGEFVGTVKKVEKTFFIIDTKLDLHSGDGVCFFDWQNNLSGTTINIVEGQKVYAQKMNEISVGLKVYRNNDHQFSQKLTNQPAERKIGLSIKVQETDNSLVICGIDEDGNCEKVDIPGEKKLALKVDAAKEAFHNQLTRLGNTIFNCDNLQIETANMYFVPASQLNEARRQLVEKLIIERKKNRPRQEIKITKNDVPYFEKHLSFNGNAINAMAFDFYTRHGVEAIEQGAESGLNLIGEKVMTTKYCLRRELNMCEPNAEPLILQDEDGREYKVKFLCGKCGMEIYLGDEYAE